MSASLFGSLSRICSFSNVSAHPCFGDLIHSSTVTATATAHHRTRAACGLCIRLVASSHQVCMRPVWLRVCVRVSQVSCAAVLGDRMAQSSGAGEWSTKHTLALRFRATKRLILGVLQRGVVVVLQTVYCHTSSGSACVASVARTRVPRAPPCDSILLLLAMAAYAHGSIVRRFVC